MNKIPQDAKTSDLTFNIAKNQDLGYVNITKNIAYLKEYYRNSEVFSCFIISEKLI